MSATLAVTRAMTRSWRHESVRALGGSVAAFRAVVAVLLLVLVAWAAAIYSTRNLLDAAPFEQADLITLLLVLALTMVVAIGAIVTVALGLLVPDSDVFASFLATMPLSAGSRRLALELPVLVAGFTVAVTMPAPFAWIAIGAVSAPSGVALALVALLFAAVGVLAGSVLARLLTSLLGAAGIPQAIARSLATVAVVGAVGQQALGARADLAAGTPLRRGLGGLATVVELRPALAVLLAAVVAVVVAALWWVATGLGQGRVAAQSVRLVGPRARIAGQRPRSMVVLELVQIARHPANVSTVVLVLVLTGALAGSPGLRDAVLWPLGGALVVMLGSIVAIVSYGATWQSHWCFRVWTARSMRWVGPKWAASSLFCGSLAVGVAVVLLAVPGWDLQFAVSLLPQLVIGFAAAMLAGLVVPVGEQQPLSSVAALVLAVGIGGSAGAAAAATGGGDLLTMSVIAVVVLIVLGAIYLALAGWRERDLVH